MVDTPVLFITFVRPDYARQTWDGIKAAKPKTLYFYSNKGRTDKEGEVVRNEEIRAYIKEVDWECDLHTWFRDECVNVYDSLRGAIDWLFENEEQGIVLEEDCVPTLGFFSYADQLIAKFKNDRRIWFISGDNFINYNPGGYDYIFSHHSQIYGWASWRDRWNSIDWNLTTLDLFLSDGYVNYLFPFAKLARDRISIMKRAKNWLLQTQCWDGIFYANMLMNNAMSIYPRENLITNIGVSGEHKKGRKPTIWNTPSTFVESYYKIVNEPKLYIPNPLFEKTLYNVTWKQVSILGRILGKIKSVFS